MPAPAQVSTAAEPHRFAAVQAGDVGVLLLEAHTAQTITSATLLRAELLAVRQAAYASDRGEYASGVEAVAARVSGPEGQCVAALSVPFFMDESQRKRARILDSVRTAAAAISADLGAPA